MHARLAEAVRTEAATQKRLERRRRQLARRQAGAEQFRPCNPLKVQAEQLAVVVEDLPCPSS